MRRGSAECALWSRTPQNGASWQLALESSIRLCGNGWRRSCGRFARENSPVSLFAKWTPAKSAMQNCERPRTSTRSKKWDADCAAWWLGNNTPSRRERAGKTHPAKLLRRKLFVCRWVRPYPIQLVTGGRDHAEPAARLPNGRTCDQNGAERRVCLLHNSRLLFRRQDDVLAWISKRRCAERECDREARASNRPTAKAARLYYSCHIKKDEPFQCQWQGKTRSVSYRYSCRKKCSRRSRSSFSRASSERVPPAAVSFS